MNNYKYNLQPDPDSFISVSDLRNNFSRYVQKLGKDPIVISNYGEPRAVLIGIEEYEDIMDYVEGFRIMSEFKKEKSKAENWIGEEKFMKILNHEDFIK